VVVELVVLVVLVVLVAAGVGVWAPDGDVDRPLSEPPDGVAPVRPAGRSLCLPWSVPAGDFDLVGVLPPVCVWRPGAGLAGVLNWIVAVPPAPLLTSVTWTVTS